MSHLLFGSEGIRSLIGTFPMTIGALPRLGAAIAKWSIEKNHGNTYILIAHDTRSSCHFVKAALKSGLLLYDTKLFDALALPTPAASLLTRTNKAFSCCIIITAPQHQYLYNGIMILDSQGSKISAADEQQISDYFYSIDLNTLSHDHLGDSYRALNPGEPYIDALCSHFEPLFLKGKTILLDCANGATSSLAPHIFRSFGAHVISINDRPNGTNINKNCGILYPKALQEAVLHHKVDAAFAFDGDGSRILAVNRHGKIKNGDDILALLVDHPTYNHTHALVGTTFSNEGLAKHLESKGKKLIRSDVGETFVSQELTYHKLPLGGEPSGHIIISSYLDSSDGIFAALHVLETMKITKNWDMTTFTHVPQIIMSIPVKQRKDLMKSPLSETIAEYNKALSEGRFVVRYSGTEPCLRILVEAPDKTKAETLINKLAHRLHMEHESL